MKSDIFSIPLTATTFCPFLVAQELRFDLTQFYALTPDLDLCNALSSIFSTSQNNGKILAGWWLGHPSQKY